MRRPEWLQIDRIISCRKQGSKGLKLSQLSLLLRSRQEEKTGVEFLVKWQALEHQSATWEKERDTAEFQHAISAYAKRHESREESGVKQEERKLVADINMPPEYLSGNVMYEFQIFGLKWLLDNYEKGRSVILAGILAIILGSLRAEPEQGPLDCLVINMSSCLYSCLSLHGI